MPDVGENYGEIATFFFFSLVYLLIYGCIGSSLLRTGFLQLRRVGATLHCGARASHCGGFSCCGAWALGTWAQQLWLTGLVAPRHVASSWTRARTHVPCIGRPILNHCATREVPKQQLLSLVLLPDELYVITNFSHSPPFLQSAIFPRVPQTHSLKEHGTQFEQMRSTEELMLGAPLQMMTLWMKAQGLCIQAQQLR